MPSTNKAATEIKLDERLHVEKPFLGQLHDLGWGIIDCESQQQPSQTFRENFTEVVMLPILRRQLKIINDWLADDQVEEVIKQLTASFPGTNLIQNNRHVFNLLLEGTSVSENRKTGAKSPSVQFIDFKQRQNNSFIAVCQFKVRKRLLEGKSPRERSGIIWHTQGSGKSLTMMFMVREMYRHPSLSKWKVVFVTDRIRSPDRRTSPRRSATKHL
jgi:type I site-specific restriction-modification system R (restriction) subunit